MMRLYTKIYFILILLVAGVTSCEKDPAIPEGLKSLERLGGWEKITPQTSAANPFLFQGRSNACAAVWGNVAYILGSSDINNTSTSMTCWKYEMSSNTLSFSSTLPTILNGGVAFAVNGQLFYGLGLSKELYYATVSDDFESWSSAPPIFPGVPRTGAVSFTHNNKAYVGMGFDGTNYLSDLYQFDPTTFLWKKMAELPGSGRQDACVFMLDGNAYVGTGYNGSYLKDFWRYNPETNTWSKMADLPASGRDDAVAFAFNKRAYVGTGWNVNGIQRDFWEYNPQTNTWTTSASFQNSRYGAVAWTLGNTAYVGLGNNGADLKDFWKSTTK